MIDEKEFLKERRYVRILIILIFICIIPAIFGIKFCCQSIYTYMRVKFISQYVCEKDAEYFIKYSDYTGTPFLIALAKASTESDLSMKRRGLAGEIGYFQPMPNTVIIWRGILRYKLDDTRAENPEFNIFGGLIMLSGLKKYSGDWYKAVEIYNIGIGAYRKNLRNSEHLKKFIIKLEFFENEWKKFKLF